MNCHGTDYWQAVQAKELSVVSVGVIERSGARNKVRHQPFVILDAGYSHLGPWPHSKVGLLQCQTKGHTKWQRFVLHPFLCEAERVVHAKQGRKGGKVVR